MARVVLLAGGSPHSHDFGTSGAALRDVLGEDGHEVQWVRHPDDLVDALANDTVDALVVAALWWQMLGEAYAPWRDEFSFTTTTAVRELIDTFVANGGGLLAVHTAPVCFDDWPEWGDIVGGAWQWDISWHPPQGEVHADIIAAHPVVEGLPAQIELVDEVYGGLRLADTITPLAVATRGADDEPQPVVWAHHYGEGRVVYDGFGHDAASMANPHNATILRQGLRWVTEGS